MHHRHLMRLRLRVLLHDALHLRRRDVRRKPGEERGVRVHLVRQRTEMRVQLCETRYEDDERGTKKKRDTPRPPPFSQPPA